MSKPKTVGYSHTYPITTNGQFQKIWVELELNEKDDPRTELYKAKKIVNDFFYESNKAAEKQQEQKKEEPQSQEAKIIAQIYAAPDLFVLDTFKLLAQKNKPIQAAYNQRLNELNK